MKRILEGIDNEDASLILEASNEFTAATEELKNNIKSFISICQSFDEIAAFVAPLEDTLEQLNAINTADISDEYSFSDHAKMQNAEQRGGEGENNPEYTVSSAAMTYPVYVNALRDAVLEIAKWLEGYDALFSVGKNGIAFTADFGKFVGDGIELKPNDFSGPGLEILKTVSGIDDEDSLKPHFEAGWKTDDLEPEKEDEAWNNFVDSFDKLGQSAQAAHDSATAAVKDTPPPENVQKSGSNAGGILKSVLGSIFKSDKNEVMPPIGGSPEFIVGASLKDDKGVFSMTFETLQQLIVKIIEFAGSADSAGAAALAGLSSHQEKSMEPSKEDLAFMEELKGIVNDVELSVEIGAAAEESGFQGKKDQINPDKFRDNLANVLDSDEKLNHLFSELEIEGGDTENEDSEDATLPAGLEEKEEEIDSFEKELKALLDVEIQDESDIQKIEQKAEELHQKEEAIVQELEDEGVKKFRDWFDSTTKKMGLVNDTFAFGAGQVTDLTWDWGVPKDEFQDGLWKEIAALDWYDDFREIDQSIEKSRYAVLDGSLDPEEAQKKIEPLLKDYMSYKSKLLDWYQKKKSANENIVRRWGVLAGIIKG